MNGEYTEHKVNKSAREVDDRHHRVLDQGGDGRDAVEEGFEDGADGGEDGGEERGEGVG